MQRQEAGDMAEDQISNDEIDDKEHLDCDDTIKSEEETQQD